MPPIFATIDNYPYAGTPIRVDFVDDLPHSFMQSPDRTLAEELASDVAMSYNWVLDGHEHIVRVRVIKAPHGLDRHTTVRAYGVLQQWVGTFHIPCNEGEVWLDVMRATTFRRAVDKFVFQPFETSSLLWKGYHTYPMIFVV